MIRSIALAYKVKRLSSFIEEDYKIIKRIYTLLKKLEKSNKEIYIMEIVNLLRVLDNLFDMNKIFLVMCSEIDFKYHSTISFIIENLDSFDDYLIIQKFKEVSDDL